MKGRNRHRAAAFALLGGALAAAAAAAPAPAAAWREVPLGGRLVAALAPRAPDDGELLLLVRPNEQVDGPRRLLALREGAPGLLLLAEGVGGWSKTLAASDLGHGLELLAGGLGRLASLGPLERPTGERALLEHPGLDLRSLAPDLLRCGVERDVASAEVGVLRIWTAGGADALRLTAQLELPFSVERRRSGLSLAGPPVVRLPDAPSGARRFAAGPELVGTRLRVVLLESAPDGNWKREETWSGLPAAEEVEQSWLGSVDGAPALLVRTQSAGEVNAFEDQLWRAYLLAPDRTRGGRPPALAVAVDSKRWHDVDALFADADGDGRTDLVVARPEGVTGGDLIVEVYAGSGAGRFDARSRRTDLDRAPSSFALVADADGRGQPGLVAIDRDGIALWRLARGGRAALERQPLFAAKAPPGPPRAAGGKDDADARLLPEWLGAIPRPGAPPALLLLATPAKGEARLVVVRPGGR